MSSGQHESKAESHATRRFCYDELSKTQKMLRLVRVLFDSAGNVRCTMENFDAETCPAYEALSYAWGPPEPNHTILLNGKDFDVRDNLWCFLTNLAKHSINLHDSGVADTPVAPKYLWIDQICINQEDVAEKSVQVRHMAQIFHTAQRVLVWVGDGDATSDAIMSTIIPTHKVGREWHWRYPIRHKKDLHHFLSRSYWSRLWVVQEFVLAGDLVLVCGGYAVPFQPLREIVTGLFRTFGAGKPPPELDAFCQLVSARDNVGVPVVHSLTQYLAIFGERQCEDPRDKVYGLIGLLDFYDGDRPDIVVDYSRGAGEVFWDAMEACKEHLSQEYWETWCVTLGLSMGVTGDEVNASTGTIDEYVDGKGDEDDSILQVTHAELFRRRMVRTSVQ